MDFPGISQGTMVPFGSVHFHWAPFIAKCVLEFLSSMGIYWDVWGFIEFDGFNKIS